MAWRATATGHRLDPPADSSYDQPLDFEVTYDNALARPFDDGYSADAHKQFEAALAPFGSWSDEPSFGRVWQPSKAIVGADFVPYFNNGRWILTEYGWTWESGWEWGWAPFHYGRWVVVSGRGWCWIPGTLWGPAWVSWRAGRSYVGWAALPPQGILLARPIDSLSPWRFTRVRNLGGPLVPAEWTPRVLATEFGRMVATSNERLIAIDDVITHINAGPTRVRRSGGERHTPSPILVAAPRALPRLTIRPHPGSRLLDRPWVKAGVNRQITVAGKSTVRGLLDGPTVLDAPPLWDVTPETTEQP